MTFEIVDQPERWVSGVATRTCNADERDRDRARLPRLWGRVATGTELVAVLTDYESDRDGEYTQIVGRIMTHPALLEETDVAVRVPAGRYARVVAHGDQPVAIVAAWQQVWSAEESGGLRRAYRTDFELWRTGHPTEIYLSVSP